MQAPLKLSRRLLQKINTPKIKFYKITYLNISVL